MRAAWLETELALRVWNVHELQGQGGPDWKTARKILDGLQVFRRVLEKTAAAYPRKRNRCALRIFRRNSSERIATQPSKSGKFGNPTNPSQVGSR
jgi:hypothetical protein